MDDSPPPRDDRSDDAGGPWSDLTDELVALTDRLRGTYRRVAEESGPTEDEVKEALRTLAGAWNQMAGSIGAALQDPEVKSHLKKATSSLVSAIGASLSDLAPTSPEPAEDAE